jgi:hypothetical protein
MIIFTEFSDAQNFGITWSWLFSTSTHFVDGAFDSAELCEGLTRQQARLSIRRAMPLFVPPLSSRLGVDLLCALRCNHLLQDTI